MSEDTWAGVRERVLRLAEHPGAEEVFGANGHGFRLGPVMGEEQLQALEADLGVGLPAQYRSFLLRVGGGGAGPHYGLMTPVFDNGAWQWLGIGLACPAQPTTAGFAGRPFVAEALRSELATLETQEPQEDAFTADDAFRRAYAAWDARYEELNDAQEAGAVFLSEQGCGYASLMVMTGPHRGAIWEDLRPMDRGIEPTGHDFAHWYRSWLERTEQQLDVVPAPARQRDTI
ncbi:MULTISPECIES: SMI1/KNR4 family protein [unclassified Streptomyces]|uniref:SMI1/KNR4 family protein n=1 Tax=unclassified Streptomyces TaxID=2593676 RepID=UPI000DC7BD5A|nr:MULTISPECIES: SMI1/KNR4 family protein [unclassified Streptomyces]AWZ04746.1 SMI1/KNR4 family protein [Streptomyces sp. ICC4]AWZ12290.1 SMI1/KNR4 family protein [Streptomyces sp. ICC1]